MTSILTPNSNVNLENSRNKLNYREKKKYSELNINDIKILLSIEIKKKYNSQNIKKNLLMQLLIEKIKAGKDVFDFTIAKGFQNPTATTCYANSLLQLFLSCTELVTEVMKIEPETEFIIKLKELICDYYFYPSEEIDASILNRFLDILECPQSQEDISEYFRYLLDNDNIASLNKYYNVPFYKEDIYRDSKTKNKFNCTKVDNESILYLKIEDAHKTGKNIDFQTIWDDYFKIETMRGGKNTNYSEFNRKTYFISDSKYLFIYINRTNNDLLTKTSIHVTKIWNKKTLNINKITQNIKGNPILDIKGNPILDMSTNIKVTYKLIGFSSHYGKTIRNGHYISFKKAGDKWYLMNDSKCTEINTRDSVFIESLQQSVLLVYEKVEGVNNINILFNNSLPNITSNRRNTSNFTDEKLKHFLINVIMSIENEIKKSKPENISDLLVKLDITELKKHLKSTLSNIKKTEKEKKEILINIILTLKDQKNKLDEEVIQIFINSLIQYNSNKLKNILFIALSENNNSTKKNNGSLKINQKNMINYIEKTDPYFFKKPRNEDLSEKNISNKFFELIKQELYNKFKSQKINIEQYISNLKKSILIIKPT